VAFGLMERFYWGVSSDLRCPIRIGGFCTPAQNRTRLEFPSATEQKRTRSLNDGLCYRLPGKFSEAIEFMNFIYADILNL
jgi:hypothetical protein